MNSPLVNYTFNASAKTITLTDVATVDTRRVRVIKNLTTNTYIYRVTDTSVSQITATTNVITFTGSNTSMTNGDSLMIQYDLDISLDTQKVFITDPISAAKVSISATGALSVGLPATTVFSDSLNGTVIDITNRWNAPVLAGSGTVTQNGTSGLIFTNGTTANNGGQISTQPTFDISGAIQYIFALGVQLETTTIATGNHRFFGLANQGTSYSTTNPIKEGVGFEVTTAGVLRAVIYSADTVIFSQNLTIPVDGVQHLYGVFLLGNYIFWYIDQFSIPVAVSGLLQPSNTVLPIRLHSLNAGSTTTGTPIFNSFSIAIVDSSRNGTNITDGTFGWRKAIIDSIGNLATNNPPLNLIGQSAQTATIQNIIPATSVSTGTDLGSYKSACIQVVSTGTGGTFIFEGSNDPTNNYQTIPVYNQLILTGTPITAAITATATQIGYIFPITFRYIRLRIATTITGGSIQAVSTFSQLPFIPPVLQIAQATGANLNAAISSLPTLATVTTVATVTTLANGQTADDAASTGNPVRIGGRVKTTNTTTYASGDAANIAVTTDQSLITKPFAAPELDWSYAAASGGIVNTTDVVLVATAGASLRRYITSISIINASATIATEVVIKDGSTIVWRGYVGAGTLLNSVVGITFLNPLKTTANTALNFACITTAAQVYVNAQGYTAP